MALIHDTGKPDKIIWLGVFFATSGFVKTDGDGGAVAGDRSTTRTVGGSAKKVHVRKKTALKVAVPWRATAVYAAVPWRAAAPTQRSSHPFCTWSCAVRM